MCYLKLGCEKSGSGWFILIAMMWSTEILMLMEELL